MALLDVEPKLSVIHFHKCSWERYRPEGWHFVASPPVGLAPWSSLLSLAGSPGQFCWSAHSSRWLEYFVKQYLMASPMMQKRTERYLVKWYMSGEAWYLTHKCWQNDQCYRFAQVQLQLFVSWRRCQQTPNLLIWRQFLWWILKSKHMCSIWIHVSIFLW